MAASHKKLSYTSVHLSIGLQLKIQQTGPGLD